MLMRLRMDVWMVRKKEERRVEKQQEQVDISDSYTKVGGMQARVTRSLKPRLRHANRDAALSVKKAFNVSNSSCDGLVLVPRSILICGIRRYDVDFLFSSRQCSCGRC